MSYTTDSNSFESVCNLCAHFYPNSGYCSLLKFNVRKNPKIFLEKCDGKLFSKIETTDLPDSSEVRFNTLLSLGQFISIFGWIISTVSVIAIIIGIKSIESSGVIVIVGGVVSLINGMLLVAVSQLISCFVSIERNTYETNNLLKSLSNTSK